jgi:hypothetical protein
MKKPKWKVVCAVILLISSFGLLFEFITKFPDQLSQIIAQSVNLVCYVGLAVYLLVSYFKAKDKLENGQVQTIPTPNSAEDIAVLKIKRNKIIASVFLLEFIGSLPTWITNNYLVGFTYENIHIIFDVLVNICILYFIYSLYKNKPVLKKLLYFIILSTLGYVGIEIWGHKWWEILSNIVLAVYIIYYIKTKINRINYRIANFIILPLSILIILTAGFFSSSKISDLTSQEQVAEADFATSHVAMIGKYDDLIQEQNIDKYPQEARALDDALSAKDDKISRLETIIDNLEKEVNKNDVNGDQSDLKSKITSLRKVVNLHKTLDSKTKEFAVFVEGLDITNITKADSDKYKFLNKQVMVAQKDAQDASMEYIRIINKK